MALGQSMAHLNYRGGSQTVTLETVKEVESARPRPSRGDKLATAAVSCRRPTKRSNAPETYSLLRAVIQGRKSAALLLMMFGALVAPTLVFMVTQRTYTETPPREENLRGTKSDGGHAPPLLPPPPPPPPPPPLTTVEPRAPPAIPHKPKTVEKDEIPDPPAPPTVIAKPKTIEVDHMPKRAEPKTEVEEETPLECIRNPLWDTRVDSSKYEYGCEEIEVSPC